MYQFDSFLFSLSDKSDDMLKDNDVNSSTC